MFTLYRVYMQLTSIVGCCTVVSAQKTSWTLKSSLILTQNPLQYIVPSHKCFVDFFSRHVTYFQTLFKILISYNVMDAQLRHVQLPCHECIF